MTQTSVTVSMAKGKEEQFGVEVSGMPSPNQIPEEQDSRGSGCEAVSNVARSEADVAPENEDDRQLPEKDQRNRRDGLLPIAGTDHFHDEQDEGDAAADVEKDVEVGIEINAPCLVLGGKISGVKAAFDDEEAGEPNVETLARKPEEQSGGSTDDEQNDVDGVYAAGCQQIDGFGGAEVIEDCARGTGVGLAFQHAIPRAGDGWILPETKGDGDLLCAGAGVDGKSEDAGSTDDIVSRAGGKRANLRDQFSVAEKLIALLDGRELQDQRLRVCGSVKTKAEPGKLGGLGVTLGGPIGARLQGWPGGIVEVRLRPAGIVSEMEAPDGIDL